MRRKENRGRERKRARKGGRKRGGGRKEYKGREAKGTASRLSIQAPCSRYYCYLFISSPLESDPFFSFSPTEIVLLE